MAAATQGKTQRAAGDAVRAVLPGVGELTAAQARTDMIAALPAAVAEAAAENERDELDGRRLSITTNDDGVRISGVLPAVEREALAALSKAPWKPNAPPATLCP